VALNFDTGHTILNAELYEVWHLVAWRLTFQKLKAGTFSIKLCMRGCHTYTSSTPPNGQYLHVAVEMSNLVYNTPVNQPYSPPPTSVSSPDSSNAIRTCTTCITIMSRCSHYGTRILCNVRGVVSDTAAHAQKCVNHII